MECKNCKTNLKETAKFCDECGGKVINHRLNFKIVIAEFFETFVSWDNKFFKTFLHLFTKPQEVIGGYINGVRKRYMQPFSYMLIAFSLYGIFLLFAKDYFQEYMEASANMFNSNNNPEILEEFGKKWQNFSMKYYNILTLSMLPIFSMVNLLIFRKKLNFVEHNISLLYSYAQYQYFFLIIVVSSILLKIDLINVMTIVFILMFVYHMYVYYKLFKLSIWQIIYKTIFFLIFLLILLIIIEIIIGVYLFLFTDLFEQLKSK